MLAVGCLHATAERNQVLVGVHDGPLGRLRRAGIVDAFVESHPSSAIFLAATYLWPRQSTTHLRCSLDSPPAAADRSVRLASYGVGLPTDERITGSRRRVKKGVLQGCNMGHFCSVCPTMSRVRAVVLDGGGRDL